MFKKVKLLIGILFLVIILSGCGSEVLSGEVQSNTKNSVDGQGSSDHTNSSDDEKQAQDEENSKGMKNSDEDSKENKQSSTQDDLDHNQGESNKKQHKSNDEISKDEAEAIVRQSLRISEDSETKVEMDHINEDGDYVFHVYDIVEDKNGSHTATRGWYIVDKQEGGIKNMF